MHIASGIADGRIAILVIAGLRRLSGVAIPVAAGVVDPVDGGGWGDAEPVGNDRGQWFGGEMGERGAAAGLCPDPMFGRRLPNRRGQRPPRVLGLGGARE